MRKREGSILVGRKHEQRLRDESKPGTGIREVSWPRRTSGGNGL